MMTIETGGKEMDQKTWQSLTETEKAKVRDLSGLSWQLIGLEDYRVEVETAYGETRRFIVGKSTGWKPCHLEIARRNSSGGPAAEKEYKRVTVLYYAR
jgi:hypothetical protein